MATSTANTIPAPYVDRSITIDWNGKPLTWRPRDQLPPPPQSISNLPTPATKQKKRDRIRKLVRKIMETMHIRSPQRGTKVVVTGGTPPKSPSFFSNWMSGASANGKSPPHRDFSRESTYASQEAKKGGAPHSYTFGCRGCTGPGARHDHGICTRSSNVGESPVAKVDSSVAFLKGRNASTTALSPLDGPKSQRAQALLTRSEQAISGRPFIGPLEFEERPQSSPIEGFSNVEKPKHVDIVEEDLEASLVNITVQDSSIFSQEQTKFRASGTPPKSGKVDASRSRRRFSPSVDRISEKSNESAEPEDLPYNTPFRTSSKRQEGVFDPQSSPTTGYICPPNSRLNSPESLEAQRHPDTIPGASSVSDIDVVDFALPGPVHPQTIPESSTLQASELREQIDSCFMSLCSYPPSPDASNELPNSALAEPTANSHSFEDIGGYFKNHRNLSLESVDSRYTGNAPNSLLVEKSLDMGSSLPELDSYEVSKSGKLSATVQYDSDDDGGPSLPGSFTMASPSRIRAELLQWELAKKNGLMGRNQSFEDIDEIMARPETPVEQSLPIPIPGPRTFPKSQDPLTSWDLFSATPPMPGSWPSPSPSPTLTTPPPPPNSPSSLSDSWQELPLLSFEPSSSVHLRGGGGSSAIGLFHAKNYVPDIENGKRLLDKKISGYDSYFALGWGKGMTHREFSIMMKKRADREKEIEKEEREKAEAEKKRKAEEGEGAFVGVVNKVKGIFGKKGKKEPVPENAPGGVGAAV